MTKLNPRIEPIQCISCGHWLVFVRGMYHHIFENKCDCLCDSSMKIGSSLRYRSFGR